MTESTTEKPAVATLQEIANWQLDSDHSHVSLPSLQRGFVWQPAKIINLWDSLLRGFPIGSLLLSEIGDKEPQPNQYWLLDGQQRATSIAMGFYNPWEDHSGLADKKKQGWSLDVIPVLWIDIDRPPDKDKLFFPFLVRQSHPWGYDHSGAVIPWGDRRAALGCFVPTGSDRPYTALALKDVFPWAAQLPVPMAFLIQCASTGISNDDQYKGSLLDRCQQLPDIWRSKFRSRLDGVAPSHLTALRTAAQSLMKRRVHLDYLNLDASGNDRVDKNDNSILFVRLNTGGEILRGEELIFSLYKSAFPAAKDAVEKAAAGFMLPSRLFSLLVRLVAADRDVSKLHISITLGDFKARIADRAFRERLEVFIDGPLAEIVEEAKSLLIGSHSFSLPPALATRTINGAPDVFLGLLYYLSQGGKVVAGSEEHKALLATVTALSWFAIGGARQKQDKLRQWMEEVAKSGEIRDFWNPATIRKLFTRLENPIPSFPDPSDLLDFLEKAIVEVDTSKYKWETLGTNCPDHRIFSGYSHIVVSGEALSAGI